MAEQVLLQRFDTTRAPSAADQVFEALYQQVVTLELPPGKRLSEAEVSKAAGVSRQPVRDAFFRLSKLGFLTIRPQRSTEVSTISETAVEQARFVRTAIEVETVREAAERFGPAEFGELDALVAEQVAAVGEEDRERFHRLDDAFHRRICELLGFGLAWTIIRENKAHMDRVRFLSLSFGLQAALDDHMAILEALRARNAEAAVAAMRTHLGRISDIIARVRLTHGTHFSADFDRDRG